MCRNIKKLRQSEALPTDDEIELAALQFVRKVSGYRKPSQRNAEAFNAAVEQVATATRELLRRLQPVAPSSLR